MKADRQNASSDCISEAVPHLIKYTSLREQLDEALRSRPSNVKLSATRLDSLTWDVYLVSSGIRAACLIDVFLPSGDSIAALEKVLHSALRDQVKVLVHQPSEQTFIINLRLTLERCHRHLAHEDEISFIDVTSRSEKLSHHSVHSRIPQSLREMMQTILNSGHSPSRILLGVQEYDTRSAQQGIALSGFLLEYLYIYTLDSDRDSEPHSGNILSDVTLIHFTVSLTDGRMEKQVMQFTVPEPCLDGTSALGQVKGIEDTLRKMFQGKLEQYHNETVSSSSGQQERIVDLSRATVVVQCKQVSMPLVGL
ncbi:unnamed protein product [Sympodiomycopsis kandeliae]